MDDKVFSASSRETLEDSSASLMRLCNDCSSLCGDFTLRLRYVDECGKGLSVALLSGDRVDLLCWKDELYTDRSVALLSGDIDLDRCELNADLLSGDFERL